MKPIKIDLRKLTPAKLAAAKPNAGDNCRYKAPCIIGTLIPPRFREELDGSSDSTIATLMRNGIVQVPEDQRGDAIRLQNLFDEGSWTDLEALAKHYVEGNAK